MAGVIENRYEFVVLFDVESENPNDDLDVGNLPRIDPESGYGIVTDVYLKRKIRSYVGTLKEDEPGYRIYIREDVPLSRSDNTAYTELKTDEKGIKELKKKDPQVDQKIWDFMYRSFFDIRVFGAIMTAFVKVASNYGQVHGPVQLGFIRNIDPIVSQEVIITCIATTTEKDAENKSTETGGKNIAPYALYHAEGYISIDLARKSTGFSGEDLELLWDAIISISEIDHSAARGKMAVRRLIVFKHSKELGDCPIYKLFNVVEIKKNGEAKYPRKYGDYAVAIHRGQIPEAVEVSEEV